VYRKLTGFVEGCTGSLQALWKGVQEDYSLGRRVYRKLTGFVEGCRGS